MNRSHARYQQGLTLLEILIASAIGGLLMLALNGLMQQAFDTMDNTDRNNGASREAAIALQQMADAVRYSRTLILPLPDNPNTDWQENIREETVPASPPEGSSTKATAVLAITLSPRQDLDNDGWADGNNDSDFLDYNNNGNRDDGEPERIDEDWGDDISNDGESGLIGIDDDGDGAVDEGNNENDDEDDNHNEDSVDGIDNDGDGNIDEDTKKQMTDDDKAGIEGVDDDFDGSTDEGDKNDDDEDGAKDEDWPDAVVFYLSGSDLIMRSPCINDCNLDSEITGLDFTETVILEGLTAFRVERQALPRAIVILLSITVNQEGISRSYDTQVRLGGGL